MKGEKITAILSFCFTAGAAFRIYVLGRLSGTGWEYVAAGLSLIPVVILILLARKNLGMAGFAALFFSTGLFCASASGTAFPVVGKPEFLQLLSEKLRNSVLSIPYRAPETTALVLALTTGDRSLVSRELLRCFRTSGASHLLALSGLHLGIVYMMISAGANAFGKSRPVRIARYFGIVLMSLTYTLATGASASITRAFLFISIRESAVIANRKMSLAEIISIALLIQLALDPQQLSTVGFQLSYCAVAGIAWIFPSIKSLYYVELKILSGAEHPRKQERGKIWKLFTGAIGRFDIMKKIWEAASLAIACQIATTPLAWIYFHTFPIYFLLTNILAVPLTTMLMMISILTISANILGYCPEALLWANDISAGMLVHCLQTISSM